ncbi:MAG: NAD-binding protein [Kofleriaceae bacterium]|nr:NAD-binding protein [Kofleriaceae bacterium]MCL4226411.1 NAD-binding protein [Myxococcales bacterium]
MARIASTVTAPRPAPPVGVRAAVDRFLQQPAVDVGILVLIVASVGMLVGEHVAAEGSALRLWLTRVGDVVTGIFIVELVARFWVARRKRRFFRRYWLDILAVLPLARSFRLLRALRLLRLFRAGVLLSRRMNAFGGVFRGAWPELTLLSTITATLIIASSIVLFLAERGANPDLADLEHTVWFSVYSLIAGEPVGANPETSLGRAVTLVVVLGGLTVFGVFVGTISASVTARLSGRMGANDMDLEELTNHVVVCGWNRAGKNVLRELLVGSRAEVVLVTEGAHLPDNVPPEVLQTGRLYHVSGDYTRVEVLESASVRAASAAVLLSDSLSPRSDQDRDARTVLAGLTLERIAPHVFTCAELTNRENASLLRLAGVDEIIVPHEYSGAILGSVSRTRGLVDVLDEILTINYGNAFHKVALPAALVGRTVGELHRELKERHNAILVSLERPGPSKNPDLLVNPPVDATIEAGDRALVIADHDITL